MQVKDRLTIEGAVDAVVITPVLDAGSLSFKLAAAGVGVGSAAFEVSSDGETWRRHPAFLGDRSDGNYKVVDNVLFGTNETRRGVVELPLGTTHWRVKSLGGSLQVVTVFMTSLARGCT